MRLRCINLGIFISLITIICTGCIIDSAGGGVRRTDSAGGYRDVVFAEEYFLAVGSGGTIDRIDFDKKVTRLKSPAQETLNAAIFYYGRLILVGNGGTVLVSEDGGGFSAMNSGTKSDILDVAAIGGRLLAVGRGGLLLSSGDQGESWKKISSKVKNDIVSIAANESRCFAVTREGQILMSTDGVSFSVSDYNAEFEGYNEDKYWFDKVNILGNSFILTGSVQGNEGEPMIMGSSTGEVWMPTALTEINGEPLDSIMPITIADVGLNGDQLIAACDGGRLLTVTDCSVCNKMTTISDVNLNALASSPDMFVVVGDGFWFDVLSPDSVRMDDIQSEQALIDQQNGGIIVDVRTREEYAEGHIRGAVHIPVDEIEGSIGRIIPDKTVKIIFYCAKGVRAQTALTAARGLGYERVYNLGGIDAWPYDTEKGLDGAF